MIDIYLLSLNRVYPLLQDLFECPLFMLDPHHQLIFGSPFVIKLLVKIATSLLKSEMLLTFSVEGPL